MHDWVDLTPTEQAFRRASTYAHPHNILTFNKQWSYAKLLGSQTNKHRTTEQMVHGLHKAFGATAFT